MPRSQPAGAWVPAPRTPPPPARPSRVPLTLDRVTRLDLLCGKAHLAAAEAGDHRLADVVEQLAQEVRLLVRAVDDQPTCRCTCGTRHTV